MAPGHRLTLQARRLLALDDADPAGLLAAVEALLGLFPDDAVLQAAKLACLRELARRDERLTLLRAVCARPDADRSSSGSSPRSCAPTPASGRRPCGCCGSPCAGGPWTRPTSPRWPGCCVTRGASRRPGSWTASPPAIAALLPDALQSSSPP
jgi:hypothetical protein